MFKNQQLLLLTHQTDNSTLEKAKNCSQLADNRGFQTMIQRTCLYIDTSANENNSFRNNSLAET